MSFGGDVYVYNVNLDFTNKNISGVNPKDGRFEVLVKPKQALGIRLGLSKRKATKDSLFFAKKIGIRSSVAFSVYVDEKKNFYKRVDIKIIPKGLRVIVGKGRKI
tara:strand:- start:198 stop:512 length:315 start_codon:yes stop_codon:yes gene_type:complete